MKKRLKRAFFARSTLVVARELLGKYLIRKIDGRIIAARIIETEAYHGPFDKASHAWRGRTPRTQIMFGPAGFAYVYLIYGMYYCFNIVTSKDSFPSAVLIRALDLPFARGPGKLCRELKIDKKLNHIDLIKSQELWLEDRGSLIQKITRTKRIGIEYAKEYRHKLWRFVIE